MIEESAVQNKAEETPQLSPLAEMLIRAVDKEIVPEVFARHNINKLSPSFPYNHRTMANRDSSKKDDVVRVKNTTVIGGRPYYSKQSLLAMLREDLARKEKR
jgi:hypothetical protein